MKAYLSAILFVFLVLGNSSSRLLEEKSK